MTPGAPEGVRLPCVWLLNIQTALLKKGKKRTLFPTLSSFLTSFHPYETSDPLRSGAQLLEERGEGRVLQGLRTKQQRRRDSSRVIDPRLRGFEDAGEKVPLPRW